MVAEEKVRETYSLMESAPGPETVIDGRRYLYFGGTSYLGLAGHPEVIEAGCTGIRLYGLHSATSRARMGTNPPVREVERLAAEFFGGENAFYFGSGYVANHVMIAALAGDIDTVLIDEAAHYSVMEASRLAGKPIRTFLHRDPSDLESRAKGAGRVLVMADAVGPSTGAVAPVAQFLQVLKAHEPAALLLDDAHGFGVLGEKGRGLLEAAGVWERTNTGVAEDGVSINVCGTLGKALGGFGGIVPGSREFVTRLKTSSHYFDGSSAPASPVAAATAKALELVMRQPALRKQLHENTLQIRRGLRALGLNVPEGETAHFGVTTGNARQMQGLSEELKQRGVVLPYLTGYTDTPPEGILRFAVFANHTFEQIELLISEIKSLL